MNNDIEALIKENYLYRFKREFDYEFDTDRKNKLKLIIDSYTKKPESDKPSAMDDYFNKINLMIYQKPWGKLQEFHKLEKLTEFINSSNLFKTKEEKSLLLEKLKKKLAKNELTSKQIIYDSVKCVITDIKI
jgi:hypothetical protein